ncbi:Piso0_000581 [Millerozyma farinosa CBS 7064]|uniref:Piso0_000581 protein n=1 Tax=Pichia sorbitophila (strain ATCC MYA-4447 / BCRC 22081 / CBS 7064 / NBRC 10061 / NRRL Y-12695) TaxID=559304 RepID=G8YVU0_PICSO|nr:Piso0_000581 [Millerozyma farinosa CBS 7064]CCE73534.1 Piso0_000581 [Millerozyma farinosa CBS 7064]
MTVLGGIWNKTKFVSEEIGLVTLLTSSRDAHLIILLRMIRLIAFGGTSVILVLYLREAEFDEQLIGLFMTLTFIGDLVTSFVLSLSADKCGRRLVLIFSSAVMLLTGACFVFFENHVLLTAVAVVGILTPSGGEVGPFRSIEQSSIASLAESGQRSDLYAWYQFLGSFSAALGAMMWGQIVDYANYKLKYSLLDSYKVAFLAYCGIALITLIMSFCFSERIEWSSEVAKAAIDNDENRPRETQPLLAEQGNEDLASPDSTGTSTPASNSASQSQILEQEKKSLIHRLFPTLHPSTYTLVLKLSMLFALDAFGSSLVSNSWQSYYIKQKFHISPTSLGSVFFITGIISSVMSLLSTSLTKRLGPIVTMVATHLPASLMIALIPAAKSMTLTMSILVFRASTQSMDVAPKHVFLASLVPSETRTAVFGWVNVVKTAAQAVGPTLVGYLTYAGMQWLAFVIGGALKSIYDFGILAYFLAFNRT